MSFERDVEEAAFRAANACDAAVKKYAKGDVVDEPNITGALLGQLDARLEGMIGEIEWRSRFVRGGPGKAAEESWVGADILLNVRLNAYGRYYDKGVLIQSKRLEENNILSTAEADRLHKQCRDMIHRTFAAYVFVYATNGIRCGGAASFYDYSDQNIHDSCPWSSYQFFTELFRCPIGDPLLREANFAKVLAPESPPRHILVVEAIGPEPRPEPTTEPLPGMEP
ncbi:hypothetical protein SAMN04488045_2681 [Thalassococcus halodurans]|uniref:Restriction endonuclease n=1 Tax=Thalassococcus halodurans TaxID=373675 RepID=A0A1H5ZYG3_9RHOB|nr:hypothetical protein [Thalassococcus halodurans]SEG40496.1 hypothetical protein SAMN04488045_2681 [Thalassococcus halodurans]